MSGTEAKCEQLAGSCSGTSVEDQSGQQRVGFLNSVRCKALTSKHEYTSFWQHLAPMLDSDGSCKLLLQTAAGMKQCLTDHGYPPHEGGPHSSCPHLTLYRRERRGSAAFHCYTRQLLGQQHSDGHTP
jgi:hypothetical protein